VFRRREVVTDETGVLAARRRFGGLDLPAGLAGMLGAVGLLVLLGAAAAAVIGVRNDAGVADSTLWNAGWVTAAAVMALALVVGGWVAGRMARYDGMANGWLSALCLTVLMGALAWTGHWADDRWGLLNRVTAPSWLAQPTRFGEAAVAVLTIAGVLLFSGLGGTIGSWYHRRADRMIVTGPAVIDGDADVDVERSTYTGRHAVR
jgi:hypothetical protein